MQNKQSLPTAAAFNKMFLEDLECGAKANGIEVPPTGPGTHYGLTATAASNAVSTIVEAIQVADNAIDPLTCDSDDLEEMRIRDGLSEIPATGATGTVSLIAYGFAKAPNGVQFQGPGGVVGRTKAVNNAVAAKTTLSADFVITTTGITALAAGMQLQIAGGPMNLASTGTITAIVDGTGVESDDHKRQRILNRRQYPPQGGNWSHMREVALSCPGVDDAYVYPTLGGSSSCRVVLLQNGTQENNWARAVPDSVVAVAKAAFKATFDDDANRIDVVSAVEQLVDALIYVEIRDIGTANFGAYIDTFLLATSKLGPGECTTEPKRLRRCYRHPFPGAAAANGFLLGQPCSLTSMQLSAVQVKYPEVLNIAYKSLTASSPTVPGSLRNPPNVLRIGGVTFTDVP